MERLLLVDDDEFLSIVTQDVLEKAGYDVETTEDGELAWTKLIMIPTILISCCLTKSCQNLMESVC